MERNHLQSLVGLAGISLLKSLKVSQNQLRDLNGIENARLLIHIFASQNAMGPVLSLPPLPNLEDIRLVDNQIEGLRGLEHLDKLRNLEMKNNPVPPPAKNISEQLSFIAFDGSLERFRALMASLYPPSPDHPDPSAQPSREPPATKRTRKAPQKHGAKRG